MQKLSNMIVETMYPGLGPDRRAHRGHARVQPLPHRQDHRRGDDASAGPPDIRQEKMVSTSQSGLENREHRDSDRQ